ncbi:UbiH/UbiF/VisC/COQ6 family ubiquinone biosynthesis hydroxylase [Algirhabdus cladophorae]|uniref:UbiH/UbiF/VisC/COQ6 family ubiquinone biosynthesis hydroxylase n=1 Tax=Algirhabdus cladophorae TaxID=3377108 RepID=UPI003B847916
MDTDLIIVGGGLNGPALALAAATAGIRSVVIDALDLPTRVNPNFDGRSYALAHASSKLMQGLGLWDTLAPNAQPMLEIKVTDGKAGQGPSPFWMHFDHAEIEEGPMGYMVEDRFLRPCLLDAMTASPNVTALAGKRVVDQDVTQNGATVTLDDDTTIAGALIVGADGRRSGTASRAGITRTKWEYDQTALVCAVAHEKPHNGIAHQFFMPSGPLAILPLTGNRSSIVWSETTKNAAHIQDMSDADYLMALRPAFGSFLGELSLVGDRFTYPLGLTLANAMVAPRLALIGDAAHGVHPIAGQGLNAGLRDVAALAEVLSTAKRRGLDIGSPITLQDYQQWRRFDTTTLALATDSFNRLFSNDNTLVRTVRNLGMGVVNAVPSLRRGFIREAAGLTGDVPRLMQGKPL